MCFMSNHVMSTITLLYFFISLDSTLWGILSHEFPLFFSSHRQIDILWPYHHVLLQNYDRNNKPMLTFTLYLHLLCCAQVIFSLQKFCRGENAFVGILLLHVLSLEVLRESVYPYRDRQPFGGFCVYSTMYTFCLQASVSVHIYIFLLYVPVFSLKCPLFKMRNIFIL